MTWPEITDYLGFSAIKAKKEETTKFVLYVEPKLSMFILNCSVIAHVLDRNR